MYIYILYILVKQNKKHVPNLKVFMDIHLFGIARKTWKMGLSEGAEQMDTMKMMVWKVQVNREAN